MQKIKYTGTDEIVYYEKLDNGLEVYMYPVKTAKNFYLTFNTKFGSLDTRFKNEKTNRITEVPHGTAHFIEHQMFQEEDGKTAFEYFAKLGSSVNAFTTYNLTCYEVIGSTSFKENLIGLLDFVQNPVFKTNSINSEKNIIKSEIEMYDNNPNTKASYGLEYNLNIHDNHKYSISGTVDDIKDITKDILYNTYEAFYHPSNMFLVLTGNFKPLEALGIIKENQNKKEFNQSINVAKIKAKEPTKVALAYSEASSDVSIPKIKIAYKISKAPFKEFKYTELKVYLDAILEIEFGPTSEIAELFIKQNLSPQSIEYSADIRHNYIVITIGIESNYKSEVITLIREKMQKIKITSEDLERIKRVFTSNFIMHFDDIITVCENIQDDIINEGFIINNIMTIYKSLNVKTVNEILTKLDISNECIYIIENK